MYIHNTTNGSKDKLYRVRCYKKTWPRRKKMCLLDHKTIFYIECYVYIKILRSTGLHGAQNVKTFIFGGKKSWGTNLIDPGH